MAKTFYISSGFGIADDNGSPKQVSISKSSYKEENDTFVIIDDVTRKRIMIPFSEAGDWLNAESGGSAYTEATLREFIRANFSTAPGGSGAFTFTNPDTDFIITNETTQLGGQDVPQAVCKVLHNGILYSIGPRDVTNLGGSFQVEMSAINPSDFSGPIAFLTDSQISIQINNAGGSPATLLKMENGKINIQGIPTSSVGLDTGDLYAELGVLKIV